MQFINLLGAIVLIGLPVDLSVIKAILVMVETVRCRILINSINAKLGL